MELYTGITRDRYLYTLFPQVIIRKCLSIAVACVTTVDLDCTIIIYKDVSSHPITAKCPKYTGKTLQNSTTAQIVWIYRLPCKSIVLP